VSKQVHHMMPVTSLLVSQRLLVFSLNNMTALAVTNRFK